MTETSTGPASQSETGRPVRVAMEDQTATGGIDIARWQGLVTAVTDALVTERNITAPAEVGVSFVSTEQISELNGQHMGGAGPTDVLAFPLDLAEPAELGGDPTTPVMLGDVVLCPEVAAANAAERGVEPDDEVALLLVHGLLHLVGHDHADTDQASRMAAAEARLLGEFHDGAIAGGATAPGPDPGAQEGPR